MTVMRFTADAGLLLDITSDAAPMKVLDSGMVTVVVPARNDERTIGSCLAAILAQRGIDVQVIVVDGGSTDETREVVRRYMDEDSRVELLACPGDTKAQMLNVALWAARGGWLVRVDPRSAIPQGYLRRLVDHLQSGRWTGVGGRDKPVGTTPTGRAIAAATGSRSSRRGARGRAASGESIDRLRAGAYPTSLLRALGGWDERMVAAEQVELDHRLRRHGYRLLVDPLLAVSRRGAQSLLELFAESRATGRGVGRLLRYKPRSLAPRDLVLPALLCLMVVTLPLAVLSPTLTLLAVGAYVAAAGGKWIAASRRLPDPAARWHIPLALLTVHAATALGAIEGMANPSVKKIRSLFG
jgi:succinoglycan biosynthesis protein ExoA